MRFSIQLTIFGLTTIAAAQFEALKPCAKSCATSSLPASCNLDVKCICANSAFISGISCCVKTSCSPADQESTLQFAKQLCSTVGVTLPSAATCPGGSGAGEASSAASSAASSPVSKASSLASSSSLEASTVSSGSAAAGPSQSAAGESSGSSAAGAATGTPSASSTSSSSTGGAVRDLGSNLGAVGAAVAALYLI